jgi:hypothetical protein
MKFKLIAVLCMLGLSVSNVSAESAVNTVVAADNVTLTSNVDAGTKAVKAGGIRW